MPGAPIKLRDIWPIAKPTDYKVHFARWNGTHQPLDFWVRDPDGWREWQEYRPGRNDFNRPFIFSLMQFYHETDAWLFGGVYAILARHADRYEVELTDQGASFIGRLKLRSDYRDRTTRVSLENHLDRFDVVELLREPYSGRAFPGYEDIDLTFEELEALIRNDRPDWKGALESVKGIYLISDRSDGRRYVGSAYGDEGIWSRWSTYAFTGHGHNVDLRRLVNEKGIAHCRQHFRIALLEHRPARTPDQVILDREGFWKEILLTRGDYGFNRN